MAFKMYALGGIEEVGRSMVAFEIGDDIIICDMGVHMSHLVAHNDAVDEMSVEELIEKNIVSDPKLFMDKKDKVKAIVIGHAHLDHVGGVQHMAHLFDCPIYGTPFTIEVLKQLVNSPFRKNKPPIRNKFVKVNVNSSFKLDSGLEVELVNITHSTPQATFIAIHAPEGVIIWANDFKIDNRPALGQRVNYQRLKELNEKGIKLMMMDSLRSNNRRKNLSEIVVKEMLRDVFIETNIMETKGFLITTFATHVARLKSILELSQELGRELIFVGRSLVKYSKAAKNAGIIDFRAKGVHMAESPRQVNAWLDKVENDREKYIVVCTGHQGEPNAVLCRIAEGRTPYKLSEDDKVVFSSEVIPVQVNIEARAVLDAKLEGFGCKIFKDLHVSGHASREEIRDLLTIVKPEHLIPTHAELALKEGAIELAEELGYEEGKTLHIIGNQTVMEFE